MTNTLKQGTQKGVIRIYNLDKLHKYDRTLTVVSFSLLIIAVFQMQTQPPSNEKMSVPSPAAKRNRYSKVPPRPGDNGSSDAFLRTIIDNNLFRPLGWRPPRPREPYRLIGTILPRDENTYPRAILQTTAGNKTYIVTIGDNLDTNTQVVSLQHKQVVLETDGKQRTLRLSIRF